MIIIKVTICFEKRYWIGAFERVDKEGYAIARHIFGVEPTDPEVYDFVIHHYQELNFGPLKEFQLEIKRINQKECKGKCAKQEGYRVFPG